MTSRKANPPSTLALSPFEIILSNLSPFSDSGDQIHRSVCKIHLGDGLFDSDAVFNDSLIFHLRYWNDKGPTSKGIILTARRWLELEFARTMLQLALTDLKDGQDVQYSYTLGGNWYASVETGYLGVNIREFWLPPLAFDIEPTKRGLRLNFAQWKILFSSFAQFKKRIPELEKIIPCDMQESHRDIKFTLKCPECNPNEYHEYQ